MLINVGRGLSPGPMSISSSSSADVNPYPSFPSPAKSMLDTGRGYVEANFGRPLESASFYIAMLNEGSQILGFLL